MKRKDHAQGDNVDHQTLYHTVFSLWGEKFDDNDSTIQSEMEIEANWGPENRKKHNATDAWEDGDGIGCGLTRISKKTKGYVRKQTTAIDGLVLLSHIFQVVVNK